MLVIVGLDPLMLMIKNTYNVEVNQLINALRDLKPEDCPYKINLHCHTIISDGSLSPEDLIQQATQMGVSILSVTDHHSTEAYPRIKDWISLYNSPVRLISGIEISCLLSKCLVHVLGFGFNVYDKSMRNYSQGSSPTGKFLQADFVVNSIHEAGGLVVLAHPGRYRLPFEKLIRDASALGFDGVEVWYDYEHKEFWSYSPFICSRIQKEVQALGLYSTLGTDTHGYKLTGR